MALAAALALLPPLASVAGTLPGGPGISASTDWVADDTRDDPGWSTVTFTTDGGEVRLGVSMTLASGPRHWGMRLYDDAETVRAGWSSASMGSGLHVLLNASAGDRSLHVEEPEPGDGGLGAGPAVGIPRALDLDAGTYHVLYWAAGDLRSWGWYLDAADGTTVTVDGQKDGAEAYLFTAEDFRGTVTASTAAAGQTAHANVDTDRSLGIGGAFVGTFARFGDGDDRLTATTPDGDEAVCPCSWRAFDGPTAPGPGRYVFHAEGAGAGWTVPDGPDRDDGFYLGGVDARLPG